MAFLPIEKSNNDIGEIKAFMRNTAPYGYLKCDGSIYNISDYPLLANMFKNEFGSYNYFGGNGTTTFAVPDLRGEFLRGTGTNGHGSCGSGSSVGAHQNPTIHYASGASGGAPPRIYGGFSFDGGGITNSDYIHASNGGRYANVGYSDTYSGIATYSSRPTNTSVLYCIKAY